MGAFQAQPDDGLAHVEEIMQGKVVTLFHDTAKLHHLSQPAANLVGTGRRGNGIHAVLAQRGETTLAEQLTYLVETNFLLEIIRICHSHCRAKLGKNHHSRKNGSKNLHKTKNTTNFALAFSTAPNLFLGANH